MDARKSLQAGNSASAGWWIVVACFLLSGFAGLLYETVWLRQFAAVFGTSEAALGAVLAAYMGGLALGAALASKFADRIKRPVLTYGLLELGVALGALSVPFGLQAANAVRIWLCGGQAELPAAGGALEIAADTLLVFVLMLIPTACMGATLPMLARHVVGDQDNTGRVGLLYGINTIGAVFGTLITAFYFMPTLGLQATIFVGAGINLAVFGLAALLQKSLPETDPNPTTPAPANQPAATTLDPPEASIPLAPLAVFIGLASAASFTYEVMWTRLLGQILGGSLFAFATMLAAFLTGIALGSALAVRLIRKGHSALRLFLFAQTASAVATVTMFAAIDFVPTVSQWIGSGLTGGFFANVGLCLAVLLPSTIAIGMSLPLAIEIAARGRTDLPTITGRLYAASTVGAIVGSLLCGHLLLPVLGFHGTVAVAAFVNLAVAGCVLYWERPPLKRVPIAVAVPAVAAVLVAVGGPDDILRYRPLQEFVHERRAVYSSVGASANVVLAHEEMGYRLMCNGLPESLVSPKGAVGGSSSGARWLSALPVLARPDAKSMLIIGLGGGSVVEGVPETIETIDTVELEPKVVEAIQQIADVRKHDPLSDARMRLVINDARGALSLTNKKFDAIVSQPSHPWTAGASHLYTREFLQIARARLNENGVLLQWMNSSFATEELVQSLGATMLDVFEHARLYQPADGVLMFLASDSPLKVEEQIIETGRPLRAGLTSLREIGVNSVYDVATALMLDEPALRKFSTGAPLLTDNDNGFATRSAWRPGGDFAEMDPEVFRACDALIHRAGAEPLTDRLGLDPARLVRGMLLTKQVERARMMAESLSRRRDRLVAEGFVELQTGNAKTGLQRFRAALDIAPDDRDARFKMLEIALPQIATGRVSETIQLTSGTTVSLQSPLIPAAAAYYSQNWEQLQFLDGQLGTAGPSDIWLPLCLCFRAAWRTKVVDPERRERYGEEALELVDRAMSIEPTVFAGIIRLQAAEQTGRIDEWLESAVHLARMFESHGHAVTPQLAKSLAGQVLNHVRTLTPETQWHEDRIDHVRNLYQQVLAAASNPGTAVEAE